jgi:multiple sugar transport system permease protein
LASVGKSRKAPIAFILPSFVLLIPIFLLPLGLGIYLSLHDKSLGFPQPITFVGLTNYHSDVVNTNFYSAVKVTAEFMAVAIFIQIPIGVLLATLLHSTKKFVSFFRSSLLIPMLLTPVAVALMWRFMFSSELGIINWLLKSLAILQPDWLGNVRAAFFAIAIVDSWQSIPFVILITLAGLASMPLAPQEAAIVDGATAIQRFRFVTLPLLKPVLLVILLIRIIDSFKLFDIIFILTRGGPGTATQTLSMLDYNTAFTFLATSRAAAIGVVLAAMSLPLYLLWKKIISVSA